MECLNIVLYCIVLLFLSCSASNQKLSSTGRNVCLSPRNSALVCCSGWAQQGDECTIPLCEGENACMQDEVCVYPGKCGCKPGFYGFQCKTTCPPEFWGLDCRGQCLCHPHGLCDPATGTCKCFPNHWGNLCQNSCKCGRHGRCNSVYGNCTCDEGWWSSTCTKVCQCHPRTSSCDPATGHCHCKESYWGQKCSHRCNCHTSPCHQYSGECQCTSGWCDQPCANGTFGDSCLFLCRPCYHGHCDHVTGSCLCQPGFQGERCNSSCPDKMYGINCSSSCDCGENSCHPATGECPYSIRTGLLAGLLIPLLILILALMFCCCCCGTPADRKDRVAVGDGNTTGRMKHHVYTVLANMTSAMPCPAFWSSGLPRVTVSHHDPELTFNHSFIEPPSGWVSDSFETDEDGEAVYCVPPREDIPAVAGGELQFQEMGSKCNFLSEPPTFSSEDMSLAFGIPRTSSIAKSKRPSVSFAEGTKFSPKERRGSSQELARKPKTPWGTLMLSSLQGAQGSHKQTEGESEETSDEAKSFSEEQDVNSLPEADPERYGFTPTRTHSTVPGSRRNTPQPQPSSEGTEMDTGTEKLSTVYVTVGKPLRASKTDLGSEGPVQAMLRRLGSIQRQREEGSQPKIKVASMTKPPRRKLGARASLWEQTAGSGQSDVVMRKPSRRKHTSLSSPCTIGATDSLQENSAPRRPLSSILKSVPESTTQVSGEFKDTRTASESDTKSEAIYETVAMSNEASTYSEVITDETLQEPKYENIFISHS
ncbi:Scavenger receptor class F member 1 [Bagarius yarrelli]|uniref:Scavenger receptor class F member 1 n=1 Tax=Bagarius yarrelli TaxID=175774 RepID=A0A556U7G4_BAGYA|nr:Scavenger receptor class F member 1 [Bagarius yarrelli]